MVRTKVIGGHGVQGTGQFCASRVLGPDLGFAPRHLMGVEVDLCLASP